MLFAYETPLVRFNHNLGMLVLAVAIYPVTHPIHGGKPHIPGISPRARKPYSDPLAQIKKKHGIQFRMSEPIELTPSISLHEQQPEDRTAHNFQQGKIFLRFIPSHADLISDSKDLEFVSIFTSQLPTFALIESQRDTLAQICKFAGCIGGDGLRIIQERVDCGLPHGVRQTYVID